MSSNQRVVEVSIIGRSATAVAQNNTVSSANVQSQNPYLALTPPGGSEGQVQYNHNNGFAGSSGVYYDSSNNQLRIQNGKLLLSNSYISITGISNTGAFSIKDGTVDIFRIDTVNKKIYFNFNSSIGDYYFGIGTDSPTEKLSITGGNLKVDGTGYFKDLYSNNLKVATESFVSSASGVIVAKNNFQFFSTGINTGQNYQDIPYPITLSYTPKLVADFRNSNINFNVFYSCELTNITTTGFKAQFSDIIRETGNILTVFVGSSYY